MSSQTTFVAETLLPTRHGFFRLRGYRHTSDGGKTSSEPSAIIVGDVRGKEEVAVRVHDACFTSEVLGSLKCDCADQLCMALNKIQATPPGIVIYLQQEGRGIGLANKIAAYSLQELGMDTVDANRLLGLPDDTREYSSVRNILEELGVKSVRLMTNNPRKIQLLTEIGVNVVGRLPCEVPGGEFSQNYLDTKRARMAHMINRLPRMSKSELPKSLSSSSASTTSSSSASTTSSSSASTTLSSSASLSSSAPAALLPPSSVPPIASLSTPVRSSLILLEKDTLPEVHSAPNDENADHEVDRAVPARESDKAAWFLKKSQGNFRMSGVSTTGELASNLHKAATQNRVSQTQVETLLAANRSEGDENRSGGKNSGSRNDGVVNENIKNSNNYSSIHNTPVQINADASSSFASSSLTLSSLASTASAFSSPPPNSPFAPAPDGKKSPRWNVSYSNRSSSPPTLTPAISTSQKVPMIKKLLKNLSNATFSSIIPGNSWQSSCDDRTNNNDNSNRTSSSSDNSNRTSSSDNSSRTSSNHHHMEESERNLKRSRDMVPNSSTSSPLFIEEHVERRTAEAAKDRDKGEREREEGGGRLGESGRKAVGPTGSQIGASGLKRNSNDDKKLSPSLTPLPLPSHPLNSSSFTSASVAVSPLGKDLLAPGSFGSFSSPPPFVPIRVLDSSSGSLYPSPWPLPCLPCYA